MLQFLVGKVNEVLYGFERESGFFFPGLLIIVLLLGGFYFTVRSRFSQFRLLGAQFKAVSEKPKITPFAFSLF